MTFRRALILGSALFLSPPPGCYAGPCSGQIAEMQARVYARLNARAPEGPGDKETRRPAELKLRDLNTQAEVAAGDALDRAREADLAGDNVACERALVEARKAIGKAIEK
jgi:hypothetical protein